MPRLPRLVGILLLAVCAGPAHAIAVPPSAAARLTCGDRGEAPQKPGAGIRSNEELMASETFQRAIADVQRLGIVAGFCELRPDTLTLDLGEGAFTSTSTDYNLSRVHAAYRALTEFRPESSLELHYQDRLVGWYTAAGLSWIERPSIRPTGPAPGAGTEQAAEPREWGPRRGFHFAAGGGGGSFDRQCRGCAIDGKTGLSGYLALGGLIDRKTVLGLEGTGWTQEESDFRTEAYGLMVSVTRYASSTSGLFLRAGAGLVGYRNDGDLSAKGAGFSGRLGYDVGLGDSRVHLTPYLGYVRSFDGVDLERDGEEVGFNFVISLLQLGLGVSVY